MCKTSVNPIFNLARRRFRGVLALVTATAGPSYRAVGASMIFTEDGLRIGSLSSGCIENDLALHAAEVRTSGNAKTITYGAGSPYVDIQLPCGGALEILLIAQPSETELDLILDVLRKRTATKITISKRTGSMLLSTADETIADRDRFNLTLTPPLRFCVFGSGPEARYFVQLTQVLGYEGQFASPDQDALSTFSRHGWDAIALCTPACPPEIQLDQYTAAVLFFHDHEWEAPLLRNILRSDAFYIGAQGSKAASKARLLELEAMGVSAQQQKRIVGPVGLIPSTRDPQTLAVSVLAEILHKAQTA
ncbi:XdhC family protein [Pseudorhodobacter aquimaris]|uniref:XdhC family protein n=1 Tax=Pseudorhodobacter aquimaris TaxID=687412 RepID=UPI000AF10CC4|nr:XdhC family protein [Pseudorhodobacter aquimaris]